KKPIETQGKEWFKFEENEIYDVLNEAERWMLAIESGNVGTTEYDLDMPPYRYCRVAFEAELLFSNWEDAIGDIRDAVTSSLHLSGELPASQRDVPSPRASVRAGPALPPVRWVNPIALVISYRQLIYKDLLRKSTPSGCVCISPLKRRGLDAKFILKY
ncbi:MAG: hypothetical protein DSY42_04630, partial [Aquifex sp.]